MFHCQIKEVNALTCQEIEIVGVKNPDLRKGCNSHIVSQLILNVIDYIALTTSCFYPAHHGRLTFTVRLFLSLG